MSSDNNSPVKGFRSLGGSNQPQKPDNQEDAKNNPEPASNPFVSPPPSPSSSSHPAYSVPTLQPPRQNASQSAGSSAQPVKQENPSYDFGSQQQQNRQEQAYYHQTPQGAVYQNYQNQDVNSPPFDKNGQLLGITSIILGIITFGIQLLGGLICGWVGWPLGIAAVVTGVMAISRGYKGLGIGGIAFSGVGVVVQVLVLFGVVNFFSKPSVPHLENYQNNHPVIDATDSVVEAVDVEKKSEEDIYELDSSLGPYVERPAGFVHTEVLSIGVIYNGSGYTGALGFGPRSKSARVNVYVKNNTSFAIDKNSTVDFLRVETINMSDNLGTKYQCETFPVSEQSNPVDIDAGQASTVAYFYCSPQVKPEAKFLNVDVKLSNWGNYELQIPILSDIEKTQIKYKVNRDRPNLDIDITFYSTIPTPLAGNYDNISAIDNTGKKYTREFCDTRNTGSYNKPPDSDVNSYFSLLAENTDHGPDLGCRFTEPLNPNANSITLIMTLQGKTISFTAPINTLQGPIYYDSAED